MFASIKKTETRLYTCIEEANTHCLTLKSPIYYSTYLRPPSEMDEFAQRGAGTFPYIAALLHCCTATLLHCCTATLNYPYSPPNPTPTPLTRWCFGGCQDHHESPQRSRQYRRVQCRCQQARGGE